MKPTTGRIVLYTDPFTRVAHAAIVTGVNADGSVSLHVFNRPGQYDLEAVSETMADAGSDAATGMWCWPPRAP